MSVGTTLATCDCCNRDFPPNDVAEFRIGMEFFELCTGCRLRFSELLPAQLSFIGEHFKPRSLWSL